MSNAYLLTDNARVPLTPEQVERLNEATRIVPCDGSCDGVPMDNGERDLADVEAWHVVPNAIEDKDWTPSKENEEVDAAFVRICAEIGHVITGA